MPMMNTSTLATRSNHLIPPVNGRTPACGWPSPPYLRRTRSFDASSGWITVPPVATWAKGTVSGL